MEYIYDEATPFTEEQWERIISWHRKRSGREVMQELYGSWLSESDEEHKLRELAEQYHTRCDFFDKGLLPYDGEDRGRMNANALRVRGEIILKGCSMGFTEEQVVQAIRNYVPKRGDIYG